MTADSQSSDRDANGQFTTGNSGGPGRPRAVKKSISEAELRRLATPIVATDAYQLARNFDELTDTVASIMNGDSYSDEAKQCLRVEIENQRLASILMNQRLRQELKLSLGK